MILDRNVLVLGAGARVPYGFPDGRLLINKILESLPEESGHTDFMQLFYQVNEYSASVPDLSLAQFRKALMESGHTSIDSFLATHVKRQGFVAIGKAAVAYTLLPLEYRHNWGRTSSPTDDWMSLLFEKMLTGCLDSPETLVKNNPISFVDFNYDRSLEDFLCTRIAATYGLSRVDAWSHGQEFEVVHVYGSLGPFDPTRVAVGLNTSLTPLKPGDIKEAAQSIRLMYEEREQLTVQRAQALIGAAQRVTFLGFGFDRDNIKRLNLNQVCQGMTVHATAYGLANTERVAVINGMNPTSVVLGEKDHKSRDFLLEREPIRW